jgi:hypothetical protein
MKTKILQFGKTAVFLNIFGILFSGLVFPVLATVCCPQPIWCDAETFIQSFHWLQTATFFCGYFLVTGSLLTFVTLFFLAEKEKKIIALAGLLINTIFTAIVVLNYIIQTTFVPYLATNNPPETGNILAMFSMANPGSLAWALEMYGWGGIGLSFLFMAFIFREQKPERILRTLFLANGSTSVAAAVLTSIDMNWIFSPVGFAALIIWNLLVLVIDIFLLKYFKRVKINIEK